MRDTNAGTAQKAKQPHLPSSNTAGGQQQPISDQQQALVPYSATWYVGNMRRAAAETALANCHDGTFLVRDSSSRTGEQGKFQLLPPAPPYYPFLRGKNHTRVNVWSFTVD